MDVNPARQNTISDTDKDTTQSIAPTQSISTKDGTIHDKTSAPFGSTQSDKPTETHQLTGGSPENPITIGGLESKINTQTTNVEQPIPQEVQKPDEVISTPEINRPEVSTQPKENEPSNNAPLNTQQNDKPEHVVDMRTGSEKLYNVSENADKLTTIADLEEKEFIEEVEKHHARN